MNIDLLHGDCLDLMPSIPDGSIDLVLADLPYGTTACKWDTIIPLEPLWKEYKRVIKRNGAIVLTASQPFTSALVMSNPKWFKYAWVWDKVLANGFLDSKHRPMKRHEDICVFYQVQPTYNPQMEPRDKIRVNKGTGKWYGDGEDSAYGKRAIVSGIYTERYPTTIVAASNANQANKQHPTQKPVALMEYLIRTYTNEGETVLDNTMGSGTTGVACVHTGRNFIGIEKDAGYFAIAERRITEAQQQAKQLTLEGVA